MCYNCGFNPCTCNNQNYSYNWYTIENYNCNPCSSNNVCKKRIPAFCTYYKGPNLDALNLTTDVNIELVLANVNIALKQSQAKIEQLLTHINHLNTRLNTLETGTDVPPYVIN